MPKKLDLTGQRFGRLTVLEFAARQKRPQQCSKIFWRCQCDCGEIREIYASSLRNGRTKSCGCLQRESTQTESHRAAATKHGHCVGSGVRSPEMRSYHNAHQRCTNPNNKNYRDYGGRGIEFRFQSFTEFIEEVGLRPSPELTLDRINNEGHYEAGNVRWATRSEQAYNRRRRDALTVHTARSLA
jgi:hypothetical protein